MAVWKVAAEVFQGGQLVTGLNDQLIVASQILQTFQCGQRAKLNQTQGLHKLEQWKERIKILHVAHL